jgi:regulator of sigma E protease
MNILHILEVILAFGFMIFIHEGGHFMACRLFGVDVDEFALGFGNTLVSRKWGKTLYSIRAFPLGGFCKPRGGDLSGQTAEEMYAKPPEPGEFLYASWWKRVVIFLAGPGMNFLSAIVIVFLLFVVLGEPVSTEKPLLGFVPPGSLAEKAGLQRGDRILKVDGKETQSYQNVLESIPAPGKSCLLSVDRGGKSLEIKFQVLPAAGQGATAVNWGLYDQTRPFIGEAAMGQPARNSGIQDGDEVVSINGKQPADWSETAYLIRSAKTDPLQIVIRRDGQTHIVAVGRIFTGDYMAIGISPKEEEPTYKQLTLLGALKDSVNFTLDRTGAILAGIGNMVIAKISLKDSVAGPITIMRMMYHRAAEKIQDFLVLVSGISLMLFIMNLLPIPVVDGGQIVLCLIEGIKRNPVSVKLQMVYQQVGFFLIIALMALAVFNDFKNIFLEVHNHIR